MMIAGEKDNYFPWKVRCNKLNSPKIPTQRTIDLLQNLTQVFNRNVGIMRMSIIEPENILSWCSEFFVRDTENQDSHNSRDFLMYGGCICGYLRL